MRKLLEGKNIIITGTRKGMGEAMVDACAMHGANVWAHARELTPEFEAQCKEVADKYGVEVRPLCFELTDYDAMKEAVKSVQKSKIPVDGLVNNAGVTYNALFQMSKIDEVRNQMEVNFFAPYQFTQYIVKLMLRNGKGSIVNISSSAGQDGNPGKTAYGASKAAIIAMTKSIADELGANGIRANAVLPGVTNTDMLSTMPAYIVEEEINGCMLKKLGQPEDIADTVVYLLSDASSYLTGQTIRVDGGMN